MGAYKTTPADFKIFQEEVAYWQRRLGLLDWEINTRHQKIEGRGECWANLQGRTATLALGKVFHNYDEPPGEAGIRLVAFHEVCELLLARMLICATARYATRDEIEEAKHEIIRTLENVLFRPKRKSSSPGQCP